VREEKGDFSNTTKKEGPRVPVPQRKKQKIYRANAWAIQKKDQEGAA